jgi:hypothetical protein
MRRNPDDELAELARTLTAARGGRGRRSPLFRWLNVRADAFQTLLNETQPSWQSVAEGLAARGIRDGAGKPPTAERVRKAWLEVRRVRTRTMEPVPQPIRESLTKVPSSSTITPPSWPSDAAATLTASEDRPRYTFQIARPKKLES